MIDINKKGINIYNMDNMDLMKMLPDNYADLAICDPPYGIGESSKNNKGRSKLAKSKDYGNKDWDNYVPSKEYFQELVRVSKNQIIFGANHFIENIPNANSSCWVVWDKVNGENDFADCELAWCSFKNAVRQVRFMWHGFMQGGDLKGGMQGNKALNEKRIHPTQKPVALYKWLLDKYAEQGDKILDTHLGSGSIAIACHDYGFDLTACELDKDYYDAAMKRIEQHTRQQSLFSPTQLSI